MVWALRKSFSFMYKLMKWPTNTSVTKIFPTDTNILPQRHQILNIFGPSVSTMRGFHVSLNYQDTNAKKLVYWKNIWMQHCSGIDWEEGIKDFLKEESQRRGDFLKGRGWRPCVKFRVLPERGNSTRKKVLNFWKGKLW